MLEMLEIALKWRIYLVFNHCITAYFLVFAGTLSLIKYMSQVCKKRYISKRTWKCLKNLSFTNWLLILGTFKLDINTNSARSPKDFLFIFSGTSK